MPEACSLSGVNMVRHEGTSTVPTCSLMDKVSSQGSNKITADGGNRTVLIPTRTNTESIADLAESATLKLGRQIGLDGKLSSASSFLSSSEESSAFNKMHIALPQVKSSSTVSSNRAVTMATADSSTLTSITSSQIRFEADSAPKIHTSPHKNSRFTWVKSQGTETSQTKSEIHQSSSSLVSTSTASPVAKPTHTSSKKLHRKLTPSSNTPKRSKYSWVSSSCSPTAAARSAFVKVQHKVFSPRALKVSGKTAKEGHEGKKLTATTVISKRAKISGGTSSSHMSHGSRYRWKAVTTTSGVYVRGSTPKSSRKSSVYQWTAQKDKKDSASPASRVQHSHSTPVSSSGFKLRSRTKIIRRSSNR